MPLLARFGGALVIAFATTILVFWVMQSLITSGGSVNLNDNLERLQSFVMVQPDDEVQTKDRKPKKPPVAPKEPPKPDMVKPDLSSSSSNDLAMGNLEFATDLALDAGLAGAGGDGEMMPIVKVAPTYPRRAQQRGIEGYVVVEFTVSTLGTVMDPVVVEAEPKGIFDKAAIDAAKRFKYKPKMVDGKAVEVPGVRNIIRFAMEK